MILRVRKLIVPIVNLLLLLPIHLFAREDALHIDLGNWLNEAYVIPLYQDDEDFDSIKILEQADKDPSLELIGILNDKNEIVFVSRLDNRLTDDYKFEKLKNKFKLY